MKPFQTGTLYLLQKRHLQKNKGWVSLKIFLWLRYQRELFPRFSAGIKML